mgnify:FL=1
MSKYTEQTERSINVKPTGEVEVVVTTIDLKDGTPIGSSKHTDVLAPGQDLTGWDDQVVTVCTAAWTPENVKGWTAEMLAALAEEQAKRQAAHADELEAEQKRQQELAEAQAKTVADHARAKAAIEAAHAELTAEQAVLNERAQKLSADRMEIARLRDEVRKQKPQLAALMEVMEAELPADKG